MHQYAISSLHHIAWDFLFADDCVLAAGSQVDLQHTMNLFSSACNNCGLTISTKSCMYPYEEPVITVNCQNLLAVDNFIYLGSTLSRVVHIDAKSIAGLLKPVLPLVGFLKRCGIGQVSE